MVGGYGLLNDMNMQIASLARALVPFFFLVKNVFPTCIAHQKRFE